MSPGYSEMVNPFKFSGIPQIVFGPGSLAELPSVIEKFGRSALIITGASSFAKKGQALLAKLESEGLTIHMSGIEGEPCPRNVDEITEKYFNKNINVIVAIGGGSAIDTGKAVSAMILSVEKVKDYLEGVGNKVHTGSKLPFIAVPTTSGTGSEATNNAVISEIGEKGFKKSLRHANFVPDYAIVDPELTLSCNPEITAASGMDAFSQLLESYLSVKASLFTDSLAVEALKCVSICLSEVYKDGHDLKARTGMAYAAMISGIALSNAGLGLVHGFASALGGFINIPHGIVCGTLMGAVNRRNVEMLCDADSSNVAFSKYVSAGKIFVRDNNKSDEYYARTFIDLIDELIATMKLPRLGKFGLEAGQIDKIIDSTSLKDNPVSLDKSDMRNILLSRI
jgi:alcohol dehydrogenase class IV